MHIFRGMVIRKLILSKNVYSTDRKIYPYISEHSGMMPHDSCFRTVTLKFPAITCNLRQSFN
ncbi:MAG: hypothetical protein WCH01_18085, partial [Methylococcaceae bacterium]